METPFENIQITSIYVNVTIIGFVEIISLFLWQIVVVYITLMQIIINFEKNHLYHVMRFSVFILRI